MESKRYLTAQAVKTSRNQLIPIWDERIDFRMRIIISLILMWISAISAKIGGIWALVSYINFLVKDTPFNIRHLI